MNKREVQIQLQEGLNTTSTWINITIKTWKKRKKRSGNYVIKERKGLEIMFYKQTFLKPLSKIFVFASSLEKDYFIMAQQSSTAFQV